MKASITYNLPDEDKEFLRAAKATDMAIVLFEITANLHKKLSHQIDSLPDEADEIRSARHQGAHLVLAHIGSLMDKHGVIINDLID